MVDITTITPHLLTATQIIGPCISFSLFVTVLLRSFRFLKEGSVGRMTTTFYAISHCNSFMWIVYSIILQSKAIFIPPFWSLFVTTFAIAVYCHVLRNETHTAEKRARQHTCSPIVGAVAPSSSSSQPETEMASVCGSTVAAVDTHMQQKMDLNTTTNKEACFAPFPPPQESSSSLGGLTISSSSVSVSVCGLSPITPAENVVATASSSSVVCVVSGPADGDGMASAASTATVPDLPRARIVTMTTFREGGTVTGESHTAVSDDGGCLTPQQIAEELAARWAYTKKTVAVIFTLSTSITALMLAMCAMGHVGMARTMSGTMGVIVETVLFMGPLDEISWILKNKSSAPLDARMLFVGGINGFVWVVFSILTSDVYVFIPTFATVVFCAFQLGLVVVYPPRRG